ncbi:hypothetical protein J6590_097611, partial [Homalodisca vitripennis]
MLAAEESATYRKVMKASPPGSSNRWQGSRVVLLASFNLGWLVNSPTRVFGGSQTAIDNVVTDIPGT